MSELPTCPFCGSDDIDPSGWLDGNGKRGPECMVCGATAPSVEAWNRRHVPEGWQLVPVELIDWIRGAQELMRDMPGPDGWPAAAKQADMMLAAAPKPGGEDAS